MNTEAHEIPTNSDGTIDADELRKRGCIPKNRALIIEKPNGANEIINPGQKLMVKPGEYVSDMPLHIRGF